MKKVTLTVAAQRPENVLVKDYDAAKKVGDIVVNAITAVQNVKLSKGLYVIKPEPKEIEAEFNFNGVPIETMTRAQLFMAAMTFGVTIKKPNIETAALRKLVQTKFDVFVNSGDDTQE